MESWWEHTGHKRSLVAIERPGRGRWSLSTGLILLKTPTGDQAANTEHTGALSSYCDAIVPG